MSKTTLGALFAFVALGAAFVLGLHYVGADQSAPMVTTILGFVGLAISQILGNKATEEVRSTAEEVRDDLRNGRIETILRGALEKVAQEEDNNLEIRRKEGGTDGR